MAKEQYNADSITVLEGLEAVRKRPGIYIGGAGSKGLNHLIYEITDNAVDEYLARSRSSVWVTLEADGSCAIRDNGRGTSVGLHKKSISAARIVLSTLHVDSKFDNDAYKTSGGLHGADSSVVNALSAHMDPKVYRDGCIYHDEYEKGRPVIKLENGSLPVIGETRGTSTCINFLPDGDIFEETRFKTEWLKSRLHETAYLNSSPTLYYENKWPGEGEKVAFHESEGIVAYVWGLNPGKTPVHDPIYLKGTVGKVEAETVIQFVDTFGGNILGLCNNIFTQESGTHLAGFKTKFMALINNYVREIGILKDKDTNFTGVDTRNGMTAVIAVKHPDPIFEGQTKTKLASADATKAVFMVTGDELQLYFDRNVEMLKGVTGCAEKSTKIRRAEEKAKTNMLTKSRFSFDSSGKLANCESRDVSRCEIFIVKGDSAGGSAETVRNRQYQAILPTRGKILNVGKASMDKVLANAEIKTMINISGCGFSEGYGNDSDVTKLCYDKIILMTDADVDGSHIDTLLLAFLYRFMPELIYDGHVYIAIPPLFEVIPKRREEQYLYDEKELERYRKTHTGGFTLQRYKGLGGMDAEQLWETTLDPERRILKRVEIEDARMATEITEMLTGTEMEPRRQFIYEHADEAEIDAQTGDSQSTAEKILRTEYSKEMQRSYMNCSMSVITARAIPDARDGLKPVQRRIPYDMRELRLDHDKPYRKSARIVGDTMGKYHSHGDSSIYETLVAMSQNFKKGMALVDGHSSFGSIEGDGAAAMRYMEAHLGKFAEKVYLKDLDKTMNFVPNYDETEKEPEVLPVRIPNLSINGVEGTAVGMSTSTPPHNLGEVIDAVQAYIDNPEVTTQGLMEFMPGPDLPTGGVIVNKGELPQVYETGMGKIKLRGKFEVELGKRKADKGKLIISEIPYTMIGAGINKFLADVADLVESKKPTGVVNIPNQPNKEGIRIVLELYKDADTDKIKNILYRKTKLENTFGVNMLAIADGRPETLNLKGILRNLLNFQYENTERKCNALLQKEMDKKEVQEGLTAACSCIDLIIAILRGSKNLKDVKACLTTSDVTNIHLKVPGFEEDAKKLASTEHQASAILETRLYKLIGLEILALEEEHRETLRKTGEYKKILGSRAQMNRIIKEDLAAIKAEFAAPRRTLIEDGPEAVYDESAVATQEMVFMMDWSGYCKLLDKSIYDRNQETVDTEQVHVVKCLNTGKVCLFVVGGSLYQIKAMDVPVGKLRDKGMPIKNLSKFDGAKDTIVYLTSAEDMKGRIFIFAAKMVTVKQVPSEEFEINNRVVAATKLQEGDELVAVIPVEGETEVVTQATGGVFLWFALEEVSMLKKASRDVRGIRLTKNEELERLYLIGENPTVDYEGREAHLNRLKLAKRDGKGSKVRL